MNQIVESVFFSLLGYELGKELSTDVKNLITQEMLKPLYAIAKKHDLAHLICDALDKNGFLIDGTEAKKVYENERFIAIYRHEQLIYESQRVFEALEFLKIPYIPLKGSVIKKLYKEEWMRTSADVDILIKYENLDNISNYLINELNFKKDAISAYDAIFISETGFHVEMHFDLITEYDNKHAHNLLSNVWNYAVQIENTYRYALQDDYFYYYHLAHMARHLLDGGCGIKPFIDIYILNNTYDFDSQKRYDLLQKGNLLDFAKACEFLTSVWFLNQQHTKESLLFEDYVLKGGVYGTTDNKVVINQGKQGSKFKYILSRIFMPYSELKERYPVLKKCKILYPIMIIRRCFDVLLKNDTKRINRELKRTSSVDKQTQNQLKSLINYLGL